MSTKKHINPTYLIKKFEKIQEVVRVYPKNAKYGEYIKFSQDRFYKHKEDVDRLE